MKVIRSLLIWEEHWPSLEISNGCKYGPSCTYDSVYDGLEDGLSAKRTQKLLPISCPSDIMTSIQTQSS